MPQEVRVKKDALLNELQKNREAHRRIFESAVEGYKEAALKRLDELAKQLVDGKVVPMAIALPMPEDHTIDYDRAIKMVEMEVNEILLLDETEFAQLVMDDWVWKRQWAQTASTYTAMGG